MKFINGELFGQYIYEKGLNFSELARNSNVSRGTIHNVVLGRTCPSHSVMNDVANCLEFTKEDFISIFFPKVKFKEQK